MSALHELSLSEAVSLLARRKLSSVELTRALLDRIEALNPKLDAFISVLPERALAQARRADEALAGGRLVGPLHGAPIGLKDIYDLAGEATTCHSRSRLGHVAERDAVSTALLAEAGAVFLGKLATHEFAFGGPSFDLPFPPARNPWDVSRFTAGSSSGSASAVAAGLCLAAMGSDTGGSIRMPAALCGIVGLKPTYGRVSRTGVFPLSHTQDHVGPMTRDVADAALMLQVLARPDPADPACSTEPTPDYAATLGAGVRGLRIGVVRHWFERDCEAAPGAVAALDAALDLLRGLGAEVEPVVVSPLQDYQAVNLVIMISEGYAIHEEGFARRPHDYGEVLHDRLSLARLLSSADYVDAVRRRRQLAAETAAALSRFDALVTLGAYDVAPKLDAVPKFGLITAPFLTAPWNVTGSPAIALPAGFSPDGLPYSMQIAGRPFDEATVLRIAYACEQASPWRGRRPAI